MTDQRKYRLARCKRGTVTCREGETLRFRCAILADFFVVTWGASTYEYTLVHARDFHESFEVKS